MRSTLCVAAVLVAGVAALFDFRPNADTAAV